jgi:hypothetical protein
MPEENDVEGEVATAQVGGLIEVTAKIGADGVPQTIGYDFGENLEDAVEKFSAAVVFTNFRSACKVTLQAAMRRYIKEGKEVSALAESWKPGVTMERIHDPKAAMIAVFKNMDDGARQAFLEDLRNSTG